MYEVKRVAAVVKPTQKMLDWIKEKTDTNHKLTLENLRSDCLTLLIPSFKGPKQADAFIKDIFPGIFENELLAWGIQEEHWPKERDYDTFKDWFNIELHSLIFDIGDLENPIK